MAICRGWCVVAVERRGSDNLLGMGIGAHERELRHIFLHGRFGIYLLLLLQ